MTDPEPTAVPALREQAAAVLRLPPRSRLDALLHAPQPMRLVRSLPDGELYLTLREVGPHDALPLMALASAAQIVHVLDLEAWRGDRFDADRAGAWVAFLLEAGEPTLLRFLRAADDELLSLLFAGWARVRQVELDDTPSRGGIGETEAGTDQGFASPDGWHRFSPTIPQHAPAVRRVAETLAADAPPRYERIVWAALWELPSQLEEQALRWRSSRLEEHGFPPWEEAMALFTPSRAAPEAVVPPADDVVAPRAILRLGESPRPLVEAIEGLDAPVRERVLLEMAAVANRILIADRADTGDPAAHARALRAAAAYVGIAVAGRAAPGALAAVPVADLFREGFARADALRDRARRLVAQGWPSRHPRALDLLDPPLRRVLSGLLLRRPACFDPGAPAGGETYREFRTGLEIEQAAAALDLAACLGDVVLGPLGWTVEAALERGDDGEAPARAGALLLASAARYAATGELDPGPADPGNVAGAGAPEAAQRFLDALAAAGRLEARSRALLAAYLKTLLESEAEARKPVTRRNASKESA